MRLWILIALILSLILSGYCELDRIDLNTATYDQIKNLPISAEQAEAIWEWRLYLGAFNSVYDLLRVQGIDFATFERLKPLVAISPVILEESAQRLEDNYYKVEQWMTDEGANENLVADWIIRLSEPVNINTIRFFELINLAGVSPVDAVAIVNRQKSGPILNRNDLRSTDNLSYYGFSNLEDFICYDQPAKAKRLGGSFSAIWKNITLSQTPSDDAESYEQFKARDYPLDAFYRLRLNYGLDYRAEISYLQNLGEPTLYISRNLKIPQFKGFLEIRNKKLGPLKINNLVVGNYTAAFGQGLVLETNDYFIPRKTGYGWRKRFIGLSGDISRSTEYGLQGVGLETNFGNLTTAAFWSLALRDAVLNNDSSFSTLITMYPRLNYGLDNLMTMPMVQSVREMLVGGNLRYMLIPGTYLGATLYQSMYDRPLDLQVKATLLNSDGQGKYLTQIGNSADPEIEAAYESHSSSWLWSESQAVRRVYGLDFMTVIKNVVFQGEYAELDKNLDLADRGGDPRALVLSGYIQFDNFNFVALYRNYDLEFDNPYQRSFSNYQRFKGTIYEDVYYLKDPILGYLYSAAAQPQAEKGLYLSTRYQLHRTLIANLEQDSWQRQADQAHYNRTVLSLEYRPVFNYRFRLRQKWQTRDADNILSPVGYKSTETRLEANLRMARNNSVRLLYSNGFTAFTPRSRLVYNAITYSTSMVGNAGSASDALGVTVTHNLNERLKLIGSLLTYKGFLWNFEDTDFRVFNTDTRAYHGWVALFSRLSTNLSLRMKYSFDWHVPRSNYVNVSVDTGSPQTQVLTNIYQLNTMKLYTDFRIQLDYRF
jgi:DNA uptake protein ComE-like DNA-binding protein